MQKLKEAYPDKELFFILGTDNLLTLHKWKYPDQLVSEVNFAVISRSGYEAPEHFLNKPNFKFIDFEDGCPVSSTIIRKKIENLKEPWDEEVFRQELSALKKEVVDYIVAEKLYGLGDLVEV
mmetsp:Transcript_5265/g.9662  ORF Transcript_5265/g.9662 Transcript_5265/m.9662 type:complete len:122 (-) Transcript_5265:120-485(-)